MKGERASGVKKVLVRKEERVGERNSENGKEEKENNQRERVKEEESEMYQ